MNGNSIGFLTLPVSDLSSSIIFPVFSSSVFFLVFSNSSVSVEMVDMERFMSDGWVDSPVDRVRFTLNLYLASSVKCYIKAFSKQKWEI